MHAEERVSVRCFAGAKGDLPQVRYRAQEADGVLVDDSPQAISQRDTRGTEDNVTPIRQGRERIANETVSEMRGQGHQRPPERSCPDRCGLELEARLPS